MRFLFKILFNKYLLATVAFIVWVGFFDTYDFANQRQREKELEETRADIARLTAESGDMEYRAQALLKDAAAVERYAREQFHMKRDSEDVYVISAD